MRTLLAALVLSGPALGDTADAVDAYIRPDYASFREAALDLAELETCDPDTLGPAFHATYDAWIAVEFLHFGPAETDGRSLAVHFWPDPKGLGFKAQRAWLTGEQPLPSAKDFPEQSVAARGLPALERLLYPADATLSMDEACKLIALTADDLARTADLLDQDWGPYGTLLLTAGEPGNTAYLSPAEARQAVFTQLAAGLEFLADRRIGRPLGTFDKPRPELAESAASGRSLRNVTLSLQALRDFALALHAPLPKTEAAFEHAIHLAEALDDPTFAQAATPQGHLKLEILQQAVRATREAAIAELAPALGVSLGFNSQDGD